jgi:hypothetical protein
MHVTGSIPTLANIASKIMPNTSVGTNYLFTSRLLNVAPKLAGNFIEY